MSVYLPLFEALNAGQARYVVVGGLATVLHGYARLTADIDLIIDFDPGEAEKIINILAAQNLVPRLPVNPRDFLDAGIRRQWAEEKNMQVFSFWNPDNAFISVDLFINHPVEFQGLWGRAEPVKLGGETVKIAAIADLIQLKTLAGRPRDLEDIKHLLSIQKLKKK